MNSELIAEPKDIAERHESLTPDPLMLLQQAVERGMSTDQLKALVDLQEQWRAARAREAFNAAMNAVQIEMPCIVRDGHNKQTSSTYVKLETVTHQAKPIYTRNGFALSFSEDKADRENWKRIVCDIRHIQGHTERLWIELPVDGVGAKGNAIGAMNPVQAAISTGSYGQRVLTCRAFNITIADSDLDGQAPNPAADENAPKAQPRAQRQPAQQAVTKEQCAGLLAAWKQLPGNQSEPSGDVVKWHARFFDWVRKVTPRDFDPSKAANWTTEDYEIVDRELSALEAK